MFKILGIDIVEKDPVAPYSRSDIIDRIAGVDNPNSLRNIIPEYKFSPAFYNQTKSLKDWFERTDADVDNDYSIAKYTALKDRISQPLFSVLSTNGTGNFPLSVQNKIGADLNADIEYNHILQLTHLNKLLGTTGNSTSDLYSELLNSKMDRVILFEPMMTASNKSSGANNISGRINEHIDKADNADLIYKIKGLNVDDYELYTNITNSEDVLPDTPEDVRAVIDKMIADKINQIADIYLAHYHKEGWNFPFMSKKENIVQMITNTKRMSSNSRFFFLLGDCLTLEVNKETSTGKFNTTGKCALTTDYKFVTDNTIYIPFLYEEVVKITEDEKVAHYNGIDLGKPDRYGKYAVKVTKLGIKNPITL